MTKEGSYSGQYYVLHANYNNVFLLEFFPPRTATNSMPMHMNYVQCTSEELNLLDCSYSRNHTNTDHSKDLGIQCRIGGLL